MSKLRTQINQEKLKDKELANEDNQLCAVGSILCDIYEKIERYFSESSEGFFIVIKPFNIHVIYTTERLFLKMCVEMADIKRFIKELNKKATAEHGDELQKHFAYLPNIVWI